MTTVKYIYASSDRKSLGFTQLLFEIRTVHTTNNRKGYRYSGGRAELGMNSKWLSRPGGMSRPSQIQR